MSNHMYIEYDIKNPWRVRDLNAVGAISDKSHRDSSTIPFAPTEGAQGSTIWIDPFLGSDNYDGFYPEQQSHSSGPKESLEGALSAITSQHCVIHIATTDRSADSRLPLDEHFDGKRDLPSSLRSIQSAAGYFADINIHGTGFYHILDSRHEFFLHGLSINRSYNAIPPDNFLFVSQRNSRINIKWCSITLTNSSAIRLKSHAHIQNSIFISEVTEKDLELSIISISSNRDINIIIEYCLINGLSSNITGINYHGSSLSTFIIRYCNIISLGKGIVVRGLDDMRSSISNNGIHSCIFDDVFYAYDTSGTFFDIRYSLINAKRHLYDHVYAECKFNIDPLFINKKDKDYRLFHISHRINSFSLAMNSPAIGIGLSGNDAGMLQSSYSKQESAFRTIDLSSLSVGQIDIIFERIGYERHNNIDGNSYNSFSGISRRILIELSDKSWVGSNMSYQLAELFFSRTFFRFYPCGIDGLFNNDLDGIIMNKKEIHLFIELEEDLPNIFYGIYSGWVARIKWLDHTVRKISFFTIDRHDTNTMVLKFLRGEPLLSMESRMNIQINIIYIPVILDMENMPLSCNYFELFANKSLPWYKNDDEVSASEFHAHRITMKQTEES